jgi:hypothetical protein
MDHIVRVLCNFTKENESEREKTDGDLVPDCMGTAPTRRGIMQPAPVGHLWEQHTRRSPFDLVGWGENIRTGRRHHPAGAGVEVGGPGPCAIGHPA